MRIGLREKGIVTMSYAWPEKFNNPSICADEEGSERLVLGQ